MDPLLDHIPGTVAESPLDFEWDGADMHIGPAESQTRLYSALLGKTYNGTILIAAGVAAWGFQRLSHALRADESMKLAEAALLQMSDDRVLDLQVLRNEITPDQPKTLSAQRNLRELLGDALHPPMWSRTLDQPASECFHLVHLVRHLLDPIHRKLFDDWLVALVARVDAAASHPPLQEDDWDDSDVVVVEARIRAFRGVPLPPDLLTGPCAIGDLPMLCAKYATPQRFDANPYVRRQVAGVESGS